MELEVLGLIRQTTKATYSFFLTSNQKTRIYLNSNQNLSIFLLSHFYAMNFYYYKLWWVFIDAAMPGKGYFLLETYCYQKNLWYYCFAPSCLRWVSNLKPYDICKTKALITKPRKNLCQYINCFIQRRQTPANMHIPLFNIPVFLK